MAEERTERRLAAIMSADVAGYSRLMGKDETGTLSALKALRKDVFAPQVTAHKGRVVKLMGDGALVEFPSIVNAVDCAIAVQRALAERATDEAIRLRIGINLGDIIIEGCDIYGDGVNVAARIQEVAEPGGVALSAAAHDQVAGKVGAAFEDVGEHELKNIDKLVRVWRWSDGGAAPVGNAAPLPLPDKPSLAVLPFVNMSGDPEQEYFADGLTEDIITALSLWRSFPVIARNSTFAYKNRASDIRLVASELGARYVLEGSVRTGGTRVRITAQLIDAENGHHVWAEKYDRKLEDIFELQDEISERIVATLSPELERAEQKRSATKAPTSLSAWDYYQRGMALIYESSKQGNAQAREMFGRALELDPSYSQAHSGLSFSHTRDLLLEVSDRRDESMAAALGACRRAIELDETDAFAHIMLAVASMWPGEFDLAIAEAERAVDLNPNSAFAHLILGTSLDNAGRSDEGVAEIEKSLRLNPKDPQAHIFINTLARSHLNSRNYEEAVVCARKAISVRSNFPHAYYILASALGHLGRLEEARKAIADCERLQHGFVEMSRTRFPWTQNWLNRSVQGGPEHDRQF